MDIDREGLGRWLKRGFILKDIYLAAGVIAYLDSIFEEIEFLIDDFRSNSAASIAQAKTSQIITLLAKHKFFNDH